MTLVCPDEILALFKSETTKSLGRRRAVEWMKAQMPRLKPGDRVLIPHPSTGELMEYEKTEMPLQS